MTSLAVLHFQDLFGACEAIPEVLNHDPSSIEILDRMVLDRSRESFGHSQSLSFLEGEPGSLLLTEFYGESEAELTAKMDRAASRYVRQAIGLRLRQPAGPGCPGQRLEPAQGGPGAADEHQGRCQAHTLRGGYRG